MVVDGDCVTCEDTGGWGRGFCGVRAEGRAGDTEVIFGVESATTFGRFGSGLWSEDRASGGRLLPLIR